MKSPNLTQEAPTAEKVGSLIEQIESEVALLRQLHVLSQTESLTLEAKRVDSLEEVVTQKEAIVAELSRLSEPLTQKLKSGTTILARATFQERQALAFLKTEGVQLLAPDPTHRLQQSPSSGRIQSSVCRVFPSAPSGIARSPRLRSLPTASQAIFRTGRLVFKSVKHSLLIQP